MIFFESVILNPVQSSVALVQTDLYFGRNIGKTGHVTEHQFQQFIKRIVPFSNGITIYDAKGQFLDQAGNLIREPSKVVTFAYENTLENQQKINDIMTAYQQQFQQESVLRVENQDVVIAQGQDAIDNDPVPELIQVDLYFTNDQDGDRMSPTHQFRQFLESVITPRFPNGLTVYDATEVQGNCVDASQVVSLIIEDTPQNEQLLYEVMEVYQDQFQQESVLTIVNEAIAVGFGAGEDLIVNDAIPQLIQVDLYFGQNIGTTGQVSDHQFRQFLRSEITPLFPGGLTAYDAAGQFLNSAQQLIREPSKVVSLVMEDTIDNERSLNQIIDRYKQTFQQESVLTVVDETLNVVFGATP
jgi:Protein of unknown function (DUF3574)